MHTDDLFEAWKQLRMSSKVPPDFADRVMSEVAAYETRRRQGTLTRLLWVVAASSRARASIVAVALLLFVVRLASVLTLFLNLQAIKD